MAQQGNGQSRVWMWAIVGLAACVGLYYGLRGDHGKVTVRAAQVSRHDLTSTVSTNGKVEPKADFQAHAPISGMVQKIFVHLGQNVQQGQDLMQLDDNDAKRNLAAAEAGLQSALLTLQNMKDGGSADELLASNADMKAALGQEVTAKASLVALKKLQAQGAASANEVASGEQRLREAEVRIAQLKARQTGRYGSGDIASQQAQVAQARATLDEAKAVYAGVDIRAPFAGKVYALPVSALDYVQATEQLLSLADLSHLQVRAYFDEPEIGRLKTGQSVTIVWDAKPNSEWHGHILEAPTTIINYGTRNVGECLITVDDANGDLLPNTNVTVTVDLQHQQNVLSLPREALHTDGEKNFVFKIVDGKLVKTTVQTGVVDLIRFEVVSGLNEGDNVALGATTEVELVNGLAVKVQP